MAYNINDLYIGFVGKTGYLSILSLKRKFLDPYAGMMVNEYEDILNDIDGGVSTGDELPSFDSYTWGIKPLSNYFKNQKDNEVDLNELLEIYRNIIPEYVKDEEVVECMFEQKEFYISMLKKCMEAKSSGKGNYNQSNESRFMNGIHNIDKIVTEFDLKRDPKYLEQPLWWWKSKQRLEENELEL